ncbi:MAG TPA: hypothetical protein PKE20_13680, partial [Promineifilum sp.]|nr:hypothetical protein [Promineifilum sp.]
PRDTGRRDRATYTEGDSQCANVPNVSNVPKVFGVFGVFGVSDSYGNLPAEIRVVVLRHPTPPEARC